MITASLLSSGSRRRKSRAEVSHAVFEIRGVTLKQHQTNTSVSAEHMKINWFFPILLLPSTPFTTKVFFSSGGFFKTRYEHRRGYYPNGCFTSEMSPLLLHRSPDSAILQEWNYLSKRSVTSLSDPTCIFGQHLSLSSNLCHKIMTLLRKKSPL